MKKIDIDRLHRHHFVHGARRSGRTTYAVQLFVGYMEVLEPYKN